MRYGFCAIVCSFVPFLTRQFMHTQGYQDYNKLFGAIDGSLICALTLTFKWDYLLGAALIGGFQGLIY